MAMKFKRRLPIPQEIREEMPLPAHLADKKRSFDEAVASVIKGEDPRLLLVMGPCSADREDSVLDYVVRLASLQEEVADKLLFIPRVYTNKPRTKGTGYKGLLHNPDPNGAPDLLEGVKAIRHMHLRVVEESGMFTADEMLYPENYQYLIDLLSYVAVGARSVENQQHRLVASGVCGAVGMKNPTGGSTAVMLNSIHAAQARQTFIFRNWEVETTGNPLAHALLRGYVGDDGVNYPNYHFEYLERLAEIYDPAAYENPAVIIDCNHDNSGKRPGRGASRWRSLTPCAAAQTSRGSSVASWSSPTSLVAAKTWAAGSMDSRSPMPALAGMTASGSCAVSLSACKR